jgi:hypothetical protein
VTYPFSQRPFFFEFKQILEDHGCEYKSLECKLDSLTALYTVPYFERDMGDRKLRAVVIYKDEERVEFSDIRRICRTLEIPASIFGLTLADWFDPDDF